MPNRANPDPRVQAPQFDELRDGGRGPARGAMNALPLAVCLWALLFAVIYLLRGEG